MLDGFSSPEENLKRASELGLKAIAITEHGEVTSWPYYSELKDKYPDVKLLYGIEAYECEDREVKDKNSKYWHLIIIAKNEAGRQTVNRLSTLGHLHGFYSRPRITKEDIAKEDTNNLIILSACLASRLSKTDDYDTCVKLVQEYKSLFPHYYLEVQAHANSEQAKYNQKIMRLANDTHTKVVVTNDVHAATKEALYYQDYFLRIAHDTETAAEIYEECYFMSRREQHEVLDGQIGYDAAEWCINNTDEIADLCDYVDMPWHEPELPKIEIPPQYSNSAAYLKDLVKEGWKKRGIDKFDVEKQKIYRKRVDDELFVIEKKDFCDYFLILVDYINWCKKNDVIVGPGRGSAAGSLVCYLIGITQLDSIKYELDFGRFLTIERKDLPDVDVDVSDRAKVVEYLTRKYGEDRVVQVMNIVYTTPVTSIQDVGKVLGFPYAEIRKISEKFVQKTWKDCLEANPEVAENPRYKELLDIAEHINGRPRGYGIHAGGVIVCRHPYYEYIGIRHGADGEHVISVDKVMDEKIGLVKFDILGVASLVAIDEAKREDNIPDWEIDINNPEFENDKASYDLICSGRTDNLFQIESSGMKDLVAQLQPRSIEELSALIALYRPDAMPSIPTYVDCKYHPEHIHYFHPDMEPIFRSTYGVNIYQEQSMKLTKVFGGRSDAGADRMRKCLAKKKPEKVKEEVELLHDEILANGYDKATAEYICNELSTKGGYGFNASHSQAYAVICLQTAYLKAHHPLAFFKAMLNLNKAKVGKVNKIMVDARSFDIQILPPSINRSGMDFTVSNGKILFGLSAIGGIGNTLAETIIAERDRNGKFKGLDDFTSRVRATKAQIIALVKSGAIPTKNKRIFLEKYIASGLEQSEFKPVSTLPTKAVLLSKWDIDTEHYKVGKKVDKETVLRIYNEKRRVVHETEKLKKKEAYMAEQSEKYLKDEQFWEFQTLQTFIIDKNPFEKAYEYIKDFSELETGDSCVLVGIIAKIQKKKTKTGMQFAFVNLYSGDGIIELTVWPRILSDYQDLIVKGSQVAVLGKKEDESHVIANDFKPYKQWLHDREIA
ncbi:DNA polymerase III subunit alpha [Faecalibacterium prausnitzii]|uniref:DNA polymerase III subunit alpha n=1 Tax=Faecalibacterium prausnitzii TaxID=853 RepID=UPI0002F00260